MRISSTFESAVEMKLDDAVGDSLWTTLPVDLADERPRRGHCGVRIVIDDEVECLQWKWRRSVGRWHGVNENGKNDWRDG